MEEVRIDLRQATPEDMADGKKDMELVFKLKHTMPRTPEYEEAVKELFRGRIGENSWMNPPVTVVRGREISIGKNVCIMDGVLMMGAGGITIDDDVLVAANVQLISNNHDLYDHPVLTCKPVHLKRNCWVGAGATVLPSVTIGENSVVGAGSIVTKDVPDNCVAVGNPARVVKHLEEKH